MDTETKTVVMTPVTTENGAPSLASTGSACVDLFTKWSRDTSEDYLTLLLHQAWAESKLDTLKLIFHMRDCRGGKGERKQFHRAMLWLLKKDEYTVIECLEHIPFYGRWKDLYIFFGTSVEDEMLDEIVHQLWVDRLAVNSDSKNVSVSLCAKYVPSEGSAVDKEHRVVEKLCNLLDVSKRDYRKHYLVPLRKHLKIVERYLTNNPEDWAAINFEHVPSIAMKKYSNAFKRHDSSRFTEYLEKVKRGESKMNVSVLQPHEIVGQYFKVKDWKFPLDELNDVAELQWAEYVKNVRSKTHVGSALAMVDVSGSMHGQPVQVAIALGLLLAELNEGTFHNKIITFSTQPQLVEIRGSTLRDRIQSVNTVNWGMSTNVLAAFVVILEEAIRAQTPKEHLPSTIFILSDMQFDQATLSSDSWCTVSPTTWELIKEKYSAAGYTLPQVVYWNLRGNTVDFPVKADEHGVCCLSGFSPSLLELIIEGEQPTPYSMMRKAIDRPRYDRLKLAETTKLPEIVNDYTGEQLQSAPVTVTSQPTEVEAVERVEKDVAQPPPSGSTCLIS